MKKILLAGSIVMLSLLGTSCKKCATCTYNDPEEGKLETEVCSSGHAYESAIQFYEDQNWVCAE
jgi:hypothetical protein